FASAEVVQERSPTLIVFEVLSDMFGKENVSGLAAIHHPLRYIKTGTSEIRVTIHIYHAADRTAVYSHPKLQAGMLFENATDFYRALRWRFRAGVKDQRHPVTSWNFNQPSPGFSLLKLF